MTKPTTVSILSLILWVFMPSAHAAYIGWAVGPAGSLAKTTDGGNTWTSYSSNAGFHGAPFPFQPTLNAVASPDPNDVWIAGANGLIMHSSNGGSTWTTQSTGTGQSINRIRFIDATNGWAVGASGTIIHTSDGGAHWNPQVSGISNALGDIYFADALSAWATGSAGAIIHTSDGGATWISQNSGTTSDLNSVYFSGSANGWVVGGGQAFVQTASGGTSWSPLVGPFGPPNPGSNWIADLVFFDPLHGLVAASQGVGLTSDGGNTWSTQLVGAGTFNRLAFVNSQVGWVDASDTSLYATTNGGANWTSQTIYPAINNVVNDITFQDTGAIPEPTSLALLTASLPLLLASRRRASVRH